VKLPSIKVDAVPAAPPVAPSLVEKPAAAPLPPSPPLPRSPIGYAGALWRGDVPLAQVVWRDMVCVGTVVNIVAMGLAFLAVAFGASTMTAIVIQMLPVPYNIFLVTSAWKSAERARFDQAWAARLGSVLWLFAAFVI
jgi:hypothetical protein